MESFLQAIKIPDLDENIRADIYRCWRELPKAPKSLGALEDMVANYAAMTGKPPQTAKKAMILAAGDHGVARRGVSNFPQEVTVQMIKGYLRGSAGANVLARHAGIDDDSLFILDVGVKADLPEHPRLIKKKIAYGTADFTEGPAMPRSDALASIKAGFDLAGACIDSGCGILVLSEMGIGNTTASAAILSAFTGLPAEKTVGRGTGIGDKRLKHKQAIVTQALAVNKPDKNDALDILAKVGGYEFGALAGVTIAGASRRVPVFVDGVNASAAAFIAWRLFPAVSRYMFASHLSAEIAHPIMLKLLGLTPVLTANMRLGEGTGASLALNILDAGIQTFNKLTGQC